VLCPSTLEGHGALQSRSPKCFGDLHWAADAARIQARQSSLLDDSANQDDP
jgi:hypothetical protein